MKKILIFWLISVFITTIASSASGSNLEKILTLKPGDGDMDLRIDMIEPQFVYFPIFPKLQLDNKVWIDDRNNNRLLVLDLDKKEIYCRKRPTSPEGYEFNSILGADSEGNIYSEYWAKQPALNNEILPMLARWNLESDVFDTITLEWDKANYQKYFKGEGHNRKFGLVFANFQGEHLIFHYRDSMNGKYLYENVTFDKFGRYTGNLPNEIWSDCGVGYGLSISKQNSCSFFLTESGIFGTEVIKEIPFDWGKLCKKSNMFFRGFDGEGRGYFISDSTGEKETYIWIGRFDPFNEKYEFHEEIIHGDNINPPKICSYLPLKDGSILFCGAQPIDEWDWVITKNTSPFNPPPYREPEKLRLHYWKLEF